METLTTTGDEFISSSTKKLFKGDYYQLNYKYFSHAPHHPLSEELIPITLKNEKFKYIPYPTPSIPTNTHYVSGDFNRYFCRKKDEFEYIEINEILYNSITDEDEDIEWESYEVVSCDWKLRGNKEEVYSFNKAQIYSLIHEKKWFGLNYFISEGYLKYYLPF
jgi:hypothetical protein